MTATRSPSTSGAPPLLSPFFSQVLEIRRFLCLSIFSHCPRRFSRAPKTDRFVQFARGTHPSFRRRLCPSFSLALSPFLSLFRLGFWLRYRVAVLTSCLPAFSHDLLTNRKFHAKIKTHTSSTRRGVVGRVKCIIPPLSTFVKRGTLFFIVGGLSPRPMVLHKKGS